MERGGCIYMIANEHNNVLYVGVTSDLIIRIKQHKEKFYPDSFSARYNVHKLVYFEMFLRIEDAIARESQLKNWKREWKDALINERNPDWKNLFDALNNDDWSSGVFVI
jgi:putative endonuclease